MPDKFTNREHTTMLRSMTAFSRIENQQPWGQLVWELRSVNHRYLDVFVRMPEEFRGLEPKVRQTVNDRLKRGKVECNLRFQAGTGDASSLRVDEELARRLLKAANRITKMGKHMARIAPLDILRWPGVMQADAPDMNELGAAVMNSLEQALDELVAHRTREGETIHRFISERLAEIAPLMDKVHSVLPGIINAQREKLIQRLAEIRDELSEDRIEQEMVMFAQRLDVAEELDRLQTHVAEVQRVIDGRKPAGRRLDFLMKELNREANTLGSKSFASDTTLSAVDLKVIIEQMREQVQNVE